MSKVCVVGHVTSESIVVGGHRSDPTVGGTGFFSSFAYRKLSLDTTHESVSLKDQGTETENDLLSTISFLRNNPHPPSSIF